MHGYDDVNTGEKTHIPFASPLASYEAHRVEIDRAVQEVFQSGVYILGPNVDAFEREFAAYVGVECGIGVGSGTDALVLALRASGLKLGQGVLVPSHTATATVAAIELAGGVPIFVDVDPRTHTIDPTNVEVALTHGPPGIRAIVAVHLYGHPADMPSIMDLANQRDLIVVEDCAQAHGASVAGRNAGSWGHAAAFSFYPTKNLGAFGDAGMIVTADSEIESRVRLLRQYGWRQRYVSEVPGTNSRLDELQAAILRVKLRYLHTDNERRRAIAARYDRMVATVGASPPLKQGPVVHAFHQYVIRTPQRDSLRTWLIEQRVGTAVLYPVPVHRQPAYERCLLASADGLPVTDALALEILCLPIYPELTDAQVERVLSALSAWRSAPAN
jgi:dTDP-4-amino-4,6-dideoxygalactose transaminase